MISRITSTFNFAYFFGTPEDSRLVFFWLTLYVLVLVMSFVLYFIYKERAKVEKPYKSYAKTIFWVNFSLSIAGLVFMFLRYEKANFLSWRIWHYLIALAILLVNPYLFIIQKKKLEANLDKFREQKRKEKWLPKARKKK